MPERTLATPSTGQLMSILASMQQIGITNDPDSLLVDKQIRDWMGIAYQIGEFKVASRMQEVGEMLVYLDNITAVPVVDLAWY